MGATGGYAGDFRRAAGNARDGVDGGLKSPCDQGTVRLERQTVGVASPDADDSRQPNGHGGLTTRVQPPREHRAIAF